MVPRRRESVEHENLISKRAGKGQFHNKKIAKLIFGALALGPRKSWFTLTLVDSFDTKF